MAREMPDYEERARIRKIRREHLAKLRPELAQSEDTVVEAKDPAAGEQTQALDLDTARAKYKALSGSVASPKWSLAVLTEKITALEAEKAKEAEEDRIAAEKKAEELKAEKAKEAGEAGKDAEKAKEA